MIYREHEISYEPVLGTNLDDTVIKKAQHKLYNERSLNEVSNEIRDKYFRKNEWDYQISETINKSVYFKKQNLLADTFDDLNYDLIVCRNVMIYFREEAKEELISSSIKL